jgi:hypothetical protein
VGDYIKMVKTTILYNMFGVAEVAEGDLDEAQQSRQPRVICCCGQFNIY